MSEWKRTTFENIAKKLIHGGTPSTNNPDYWDGTIPWITGADFTNQKVSEFRRYVTKEAIERSSTNVVPAGNLLLVTRTGVGKMAIAQCDIAISQDVTGVIFDENIDIEFILYKLSHEVGYLLNLNQGSIINGIIREDLLKFELHLPTRKEQARIAKILSTVDAAIEQTEALIAKYSRIRTGLMQDLLTRGIDAQGRIRSEETHEFKDSPLGRIPAEWEVVNLKEIGDTESPYLKTGPFGSSLKISDWVDEDKGVPVITIGSVGDNDFKKGQLLYISELKANGLSGYKLKIGDIVFSRVADVGRSLVIKTEQNGWVMSSNFMRIRLDTNIYNPEYLQLILKYSSTLEKQKSQYINAGGRTIVNGSILNSFQFPNPSLKEQATILAAINKQNSTEWIIQNNLVKLQSLKKALMQDLLSGPKPKAQSTIT